MGFWHVYMGIYGGGGTPSIQPPTIPGLEYDDTGFGPMHYDDTGFGPMHYNSEDM